MSLFSVRWQHRCGGKAAPGQRCDYCDQPLRSDAHPRNHPEDWLPPGHRDSGWRGQAVTFF